MALLGQYWEFEHHPSIMYHWQHTLDGHRIVGMMMIVDYRVIIRSSYQITCTPTAYPDIITGVQYMTLLGQYM